MAYLAWLNSAGEVNRFELEPLGHSYTLSATLKQVETSELQGLAGHQFIERYWWNGTEWTLGGTDQIVSRLGTVILILGIRMKQLFLSKLKD